VVEQASVFRNPIEMAIESMEGKNAELETKIKVRRPHQSGRVLNFPVLMFHFFCHTRLLLD